MRTASETGAILGNICERKHADRSRKKCSGIPTHRGLSVRSQTVTDYGAEPPPRQFVGS